VILTNKATSPAPITADLKNKTKENKAKQRDEAGMDTGAFSHGQDSVTHLHFGCMCTINVNAVSSLHIEIYMSHVFAMLYGVWHLFYLP
jgi:glucan phosphorylase